MSIRIGYLLAMIGALASPSVAIGQTKQATDAPDRRLSQALKLWQGADQDSRLEGLRRLERLGSRAAPAVAVLIPGLTDSDSTIRYETATVLHRSDRLRARPCRA